MKARVGDLERCAKNDLEMIQSTSRNTRAALDEQMARASRMEIAIIQMTNIVQEKIKLEQQTREVISDAIALLKPARPEDGLLPAVRDVMQRLVLAEPEAQRLRAQRKELLDALEKVLDRFTGLCTCKECCKVYESALAAIAKAEGES